MSCMCVAYAMYFHVSIYIANEVVLLCGSTETVRLGMPMTGILNQIYQLLRILGSNLLKIICTKYLQKLVQLDQQSQVAQLFQLQYR